MSDFKLLMLSAMYENGGNTTHRMLDGHPALWVYPFESQVGTGAGNDAWSSFVPIRYRWPDFPEHTTPDQAYEMFWDEELKTMLRAPGRSKFSACGMEMVEDERRAAFRSYCEGKQLSRAVFVEAYYRSTFEAWRNYNTSGSEKIHVGYNPVQVIDTDKIMADWPDSHVLHIVRNPWSGYADTIKRPFPRTLTTYAWIWNICQHMALTFKGKYPGRVHVMRFEDMVADPANALGAVLEGIGLEFDPACLHPSFNRKELEEVYPWGTIRIPTPETNIATAQELGSEDRKAIRTECAVMLDQMGYGDFYDENLA